MRRYGKLHEQFRSLGVDIVCISVDTVEEAMKMKRRWKLPFRVLSDEKLAITGLYKVRMEKGLAPTRGFIRPLAIPMTVFIGPDGLVNWMETSEDYRVRAEPEAVLRRIKTELSP